MYYCLTKLSSPDSFQIHTGSLQVIVDTLESYVCTNCIDTNTSYEYNESIDDFEETVTDSNYEQMSLQEKMDHLLCSMCGAEYILNEYDSFQDWHTQTFKEGLL